MDTKSKTAPQKKREIELHEKRAYHVEEATKIYGWSRSTLYKMIKNGTLRSIRVAGRRLIPRDALEALIAGDEQ
jgi:excisionase family DNA binding protein